ncbi:unnamed protein product [Penicillium egyptiacum]|uniref:Uncharacterized protein n=1 Tax=Penicillium egyptiacum TaxID=1303716 RepID=A0A9W4NZQ7_9EURO|nr:unnamed protein product [Penicillium egyptiacum]
MKRPDCSGSTFFIPNQFSLLTLLRLGSLLQITLSAILPLRYSAIPCVTILLISIFTTIGQCLKPKTNNFMSDVVPGRATAQIPSKNGKYGPGPGNGSVFCPAHARDLERISGHAEDIIRRKDELGLLAVQNWRGNERNSNNTTLVKYFFRDVESTRKFAHEPLHKETWAYYNQHNPGHIGIFHETFTIKDGYESMYVNCHPILLGQGEMKGNSRKDSAERWMGTLVDADTPGLKSFKARLVKMLGTRNDAHFRFPAGTTGIFSVYTHCRTCLMKMIGIYIIRMRSVTIRHADAGCTSYADAQANGPFHLTVLTSPDFQFLMLPSFGWNRHLQHLVLG